MKLFFIEELDDNQANKIDDCIELDSRIPVPRIGEIVLLRDEDRYFYQFKVIRIIHSYTTETIFVHLERVKNDHPR